MRIKKTSQTTTTSAQVVNTYDESQENTYSCKYINDMNTYSTSETFTGKYWIDGKPIYRKCYTITTQDTSTGITNLGTRISMSALVYNDNYYGSSDISKDIYWQSNKFWLTGDALTFVTNGIVLIVEYTKSS